MPEPKRLLAPARSAVYSQRRPAEPLHDPMVYLQISTALIEKEKHRCICMIEGAQKLPLGGQRRETDCFRDSVPLSSQARLPGYAQLVTASRGPRAAAVAEAEAARPLGHANSART